LELCLCRKTYSIQKVKDEMQCKVLAGIYLRWNISVTTTLSLTDDNILSWGYKIQGKGD